MKQKPIIINKELIENNRISALAFRVFTYLVNADESESSEKTIPNFKEGKVKIEKAIKELVEHGYLEKTSSVTGYKPLK